jgi:peptidoglycan/xylan/chitin deacetylase (PgdA/CDA1 family)
MCLQETRPPVAGASHPGIGTRNIRIVTGHNKADDRGGACRLPHALYTSRSRGWRVSDSMANRRLQLARVMMALGAHRLSTSNRPASLIVFNYHRIYANSRRCSSFDDGVFDTDLASFCAQMRWLRSATEILDEEGLIRLCSTPNHRAGAIYAAVTFDDGYIDCHSLVKPVLDDLGIRAIFFVPFEMLESRRLGWWDIAAFLLKNSKSRSIQLEGTSLDLETNFDYALRYVLNAFKLNSAAETHDLIARLSTLCGVQVPTKDMQSAELMSWEQVRDLARTGHAVGSHAWTHRVLATLSAAQQRAEIIDSRRELSAMIGHDVLSFAYPVGGLKHFNDTSVACVREAGYLQAFSFNTGMSDVPPRDRFRIPREPATSFEVMKAKVLLPQVMGLQLPRAN